MACIAVGKMIRGAIGNLKIQMGQDVNGSPDFDTLYGELMFIRALDELKARR
jgi:hypothetical protein